MLVLSQPSRLDEILFTQLDPLRTHRAWLDACIEAWARELRAEDLAHPLTYANTKGVVACKDYAALILHFFNHQTHHRGQASALLYQAGVDVGITDAGPGAGPLVGVRGDRMRFRMRACPGSTPACALECL